MTFNFTKQMQVQSCQEVTIPQQLIKDIIKPQFWLSDIHMDAASAILRRQFPNIGGFMPVRFSRTANYSVPQEDTFIQFLYSPSHWILCVKGFFGCNTMRVYDRYNKIYIFYV
jgi:hypothetical protein